MKPNVSEPLPAHCVGGITTGRSRQSANRSKLRWLHVAAISAVVTTLAACGGVDGPVADAGGVDTTSGSPTVALEKPVAPYTAAEPLSPLSASAVIQPGIVEPQSTTGVRTGALPAAARTSTP
jgi:hypothetical protein